MRYIKTFYESTNKLQDWDDFLADFGYFITLNISKLASYANSPESSLELTNVLKEFRSPKIFGQKYSEFIGNASKTKEPMVISKLLRYIHDSLIYVEPRLSKYLTDEGKSIFLPRLKRLKDRYRQQVSNFTNKSVNENVSTDIETLAMQAIKDFKETIDIFSDIKLEYRSGENIGEYEYDSTICDVPLIYIYKETIESLPKDEIEFAVRTTIFHELCHAMVNIDEHYVFVENENILNFEDEEEFCEDFAFNLEMFNRIPDEIKTLSELFKNEKWITEQED